MNTITVVPAYGRDYKSKKAVIQALEGNLDFRIQDISSEYDGSYVSLGELKGSPYTHIRVRYNSIRDVMLYPLSNS